MPGDPFLPREEWAAMRARLDVTPRPHEHRWQRVTADDRLAAGTHLHTCRDCALTTQAPDAICACRRPRTREDQ